MNLFQFVLHRAGDPDAVRQHLESSWADVVEFTVPQSNKRPCKVVPVVSLRHDSCPHLISKKMQALCKGTELTIPDHSTFLHGVVWGFFVRALHGRPDACADDIIPPFITTARLILSEGVDRECLDSNKLSYVGLAGKLIGVFVPNSRPVQLMDKFFLKLKLLDKSFRAESPRESSESDIFKFRHEWVMKLKDLRERVRNVASPVISNEAMVQEFDNAINRILAVKSTCLVIGNNGLGKSFFLNALVAATLKSPRQYKQAHGSGTAHPSDLEGIADLREDDIAARIEQPVWPSDAMEKRKAELEAEFNSVLTGLSSFWERDSQDDFMPHDLQLLPEGAQTDSTTMVLISLRYGRRLHVVAKFVTAEEAKQAAYEFVSSALSKGGYDEEDDEMRLQHDKLEALVTGECFDTIFKLVAQKKWGELPLHAQQLELRPEVAAKCGKSFVHAGRGESLGVDFVHARDSIRAWTADKATAFYVKYIRVYAPSDVLKIAEISDCPGSNDSTPGALHSIQTGIALHDVLLFLFEKMPHTDKTSLKWVREQLRKRIDDAASGDNSKLAHTHVVFARYPEKSSRHMLAALRTGICDGNSAAALKAFGGNEVFKSVLTNLRPEDYRFFNQPSISNHCKELVLFPRLAASVLTSSKFQCIATSVPNLVEDVLKITGILKLLDTIADRVHKVGEEALRHLSARAKDWSKSTANGLTRRRHNSFVAAGHPRTLAMTFHDIVEVKKGKSRKMGKDKETFSQVKEFVLQLASQFEASDDARRDNGGVEEALSNWKGRSMEEARGSWESLKRGKVNLDVAAAARGGHRSKVLDGLKEPLMKAFMSGSEKEYLDSVLRGTARTVATFAVSRAKSFLCEQFGGEVDDDVVAYVETQIKPFATARADAVAMESGAVHKAKLCDVHGLCLKQLVSMFKAMKEGDKSTAFVRAVGAVADEFRSRLMDLRKKMVAQQFKEFADSSFHAFQALSRCHDAVDASQPPVEPLRESRVKRTIRKDCSLIARVLHFGDVALSHSVTSDGHAQSARDAAAFEELMDATVAAIKALLAAPPIVASDLINCNLRPFAIAVSSQVKPRQLRMSVAYAPKDSFARESATSLEDAEKAARAYCENNNLELRPTSIFDGPCAVLKAFAALRAWRVSQFEVMAGPLPQECIDEEATFAAANGEVDGPGALRLRSVLPAGVTPVEYFTALRKWATYDGDPFDELLLHILSFHCALDIDVVVFVQSRRSRSGGEESRVSKRRATVATEVVRITRENSPNRNSIGPLVYLGCEPLTKLARWGVCTARVTRLIVILDKSAFDRKEFLDVLCTVVGESKSGSLLWLRETTCFALPLELHKVLSVGDTGAASVVEEMRVNWNDKKKFVHVQQSPSETLSLRPPIAGNVRNLLQAEVLAYWSLWTSYRSTPARCLILSDTITAGEEVGNPNVVRIDDALRAANEGKSSWAALFERRAARGGDA